MRANLWDGPRGRLVLDFQINLLGTLFGSHSLRQTALISNLFLEDFRTGPQVSPQVAWRWVDHKICVNRANVIDQCGCTSADPPLEIAKCAPEQVEDSESHSTAWRMISR
jgi:hypothetical protein